jgi:superfamily II DNA/RNA helicase
MKSTRYGTKQLDMTFEEMGLDSSFAQRLSQRGVSTPTPIQAEVFKPIFEGQSVLGLSKTGTGKTFAYLCPMVQRFHANSKSGIRAVTLVPTRELAFQVAQGLQDLAGDTQKSTVIVGGEPEEKQIRDAATATWVIATPGRLLDLLNRKQLDLSQVDATIFDEADRILDMGFIDEVRLIMKYLPRPVQMLFFSATMHFGVDEMAYEFGADCFRFGKEQDELTVEGLDHRVAFVGDDEKFHALVSVVHKHQKARGIVFSNYRERAHELASRLNGLGWNAASLTAQHSQSVRSKIMEDFRSGSIQVLMASDLASRGLDVFDIDYVVNYDLPEDPAVYVHRVGRTARAGRQGFAISFIGFEDAFRLERLERFLAKPIERFRFESTELQGPMKRNRPREPKAPKAAAVAGESVNKPNSDVKRPLESMTAKPAPSHASHSKSHPRSAPKPKSFWARVWASLTGLFGLGDVSTSHAAPNAGSPRQATEAPKSGDGGHTRRHDSSQASSQGSRDGGSGGRSGRGDGRRGSGSGRGGRSRGGRRSPSRGPASSAASGPSSGGRGRGGGGGAGSGSGSAT